MSKKHSLYIHGRNAAKAELVTLSAKPADSSIDVTTILLILFVQIGLTYYLSVQILLSFAVVFRLRRSFLAGIKRVYWIVLLLPLMYMPLLFNESDDHVGDAVHITRQAITFILMAVLISGSLKNPIHVSPKRLSILLTLALSILAALVLAQIFYLQKGVYIGLPKEAYIQGVGTIPGALDLRYSYIRASGTFSEPSYLAFVLISLILIGLSLYERHRIGVVAIVLALVTGVLSESASFLLFGFPLVALGLLRSARGQAKLMAFAAIPLIVPLAYILADMSGLMLRVQGGISASGDASIFVRIFGPVAIIPSYLLQNPFGLPDSVVTTGLMKYASSFGVDVIQLRMNALFNFVFEYGFVGIALAVFILLKRDLMLSWYLLSCMMFNGSFLAFDKLVVVCFAIGMYSAVRARWILMPGESERQMDDHSLNRVK